MRVQIHKTDLMDGGMVVDVDVMPNTMKHVPTRAIFTCNTKADARAFAKGLKKLAKKYTCERVSIVDGC